MSAMMVPEGWEVTALENVLTIKYGKDQKEVESIDGKYPILGTGGIIGYTNSFLCDKPSVLIGRKGTINSPMYMNTPFWTVDTLFYSHIKKNNDPKWVFYIFQSINWTKHNEASGVPSLSAGNINRVKIKRPLFSEQQKIAFILSTLDRTIEATQKLIDKEKMVKKGLMADLLTHGIDEQGRIRSPQTHTYVDSPLGMIPQGWNTTTLGDTAIFNAGYAFKNHELSEFGLKVVRISNLHKSSFPYWHYDGKIKKTWIVDKGDLLFSWAGVANSIDCVKYEGELALLNQHIFNLKIKDQALKEFTFQYLQFHLPRLREEIEGGAGQLHLTKSKIESICIPDMKLSEKNKIVELFTAQDRKIETEKTNLAKLRNLKKGLMGDLLSGDVRVK